MIPFIDDTISDWRSDFSFQKTSDGYFQPLKDALSEFAKALADGAEAVALIEEGLATIDEMIAEFDDKTVRISDRFPNVQFTCSRYYRSDPRSIFDDVDD